MGKSITRKKIIVIAIVLSILLYGAGVFSGLIANKLIEKQVKQDVGNLKGFVDNSALDIKNIQLQMLFMEDFEAENKCEFMEIYLDHLNSQLTTYWEVLPSRIEEYDKKSELSDDYISLKREYIRFSLRYWLIAEKRHRLCSNEKLIPVLYFYTKECVDCVVQGEQFDRFGQMIKAQNKTLIVFPIDARFNDDMIFIIRKYYNITSFPATVIKGNVIQGQVYSAEQLSSIKENGYKK